MTDNYSASSLSGGDRRQVLNDPSNSGTPGLNLIPSKRKESPVSSDRSPKAIKLTESQKFSSGPIVEIVDLISDDDEPPSTISTQRISPQKQLNGRERVGQKSAEAMTNSSSSTVKQESSQSSKSRPVPHEDLSKMEDIELYSMFLNEQRISPSNDSEGSEKNAPQTMFRPLTSKPTLPISQKQPTAAVSPIKEYREMSEQVSIEASRALREAALTRRKELPTFPKDTQAGLLTAPLPVMKQNPGMQRGLVRQPKQTSVAQPKHGNVSVPRHVPVGQTVGRPSSLKNEPLRFSPKPFQRPQVKERPLPQSQSLIVTGSHKDGISMTGIKCSQEYKKELTLVKGNEVTIAEKRLTTKVPKPDRQHPDTREVSNLSNADRDSSLVNPNVIDLNDQACVRDYPTSSPSANVFATRQIREKGKERESPEVYDYKRSEMLMQLIMENEKSKQKHARVVSRHIPIEPYAPRPKPPMQHLNRAPKQVSLQQLLGENCNSAKRLEDAKWARKDTEPDLHPPTIMSESSASKPSAFKYSTISPDANDPKVIKEKKGTWDALESAFTRAAQAIEICGLNETTTKELKQLRSYEDKASAGELLNTAEKRRIREIGRNMKRREGDEMLRSLEGTGRPPAAVRSFHLSTNRVKGILESLLSSSKRAEQASGELRSENLKKLDIARQSKLEERRAQGREHRARKRDLEESMLRERLRAFEDAASIKSDPVNELEDESDEDESERGATPDSSSSIISDEDDGFIRIPKSTHQQHQEPAIDTRPPAPRPFFGHKGLSEATKALLRQEQAEDSQTSNPGVINPVSPSTHALTTSRPETHPTSGGKTISYEALLQYNALRDEEISDPSDYEDIWMYQIRRTVYGGPTKPSGGITEYLGSYYTLGEANRRASEAALKVPTNAVERQFFESKITYDGELLSHTFRYGSGRTVHTSVERVPVQVFDAGLRPEDYRIPVKIWIVHQKVFQSPPATDDLFEDPGILQSYQTTEGVFTTLDRANSAASACLVKGLKESSRARDEAFKADIERKARLYLKELEDAGTLFSSAEDLPGKGGKMRVWVEEFLVDGPRN
jgi:hypothetical protein